MKNRIARRKVYSNPYRNPKIFSHRRKKPKNRHRYGIIKKIVNFLILAMILFGINTLFTTDYFIIKKINIVGDITFNDNMKKIAENGLDKTRFLLYKNNNFLLFTASGIKNDVSDEIKEIKYITVKRKFPNCIEISIKEKKAKLVWETEEKLYLIDDDGFVLKETNSLEGFPVVKDISNLPIENDKKVTYPNFIRFIDELSERLKTLNLEYEYIEIKETTFIANIIAKEGFKLVFDTTKALDGQISRLEETLKQIGEQRSNLDYIDLSVKNKAFYKFK